MTPTLFDATERGRTAFLDTFARGPWIRKASAVIVAWIVEHPRSVEIAPQSGQFAAPRLSRADLAERAGVSKTAAHAAVEELRDRAGVLVEHGETWLLDCNRVVELVDAHERQSLADVAQAAFGGPWSAVDALAAIATPAESAAEGPIDEPQTEAAGDRSPAFSTVRDRSSSVRDRSLEAESDAPLPPRSAAFATVRDRSRPFTTSTSTKNQEINPTKNQEPVTKNQKPKRERRTNGRSPWQAIAAADLRGPRLPIAALWAAWEHETAAGNLPASHESALMFWASVFNLRDNPELENPVGAQRARIRDGTLYLSADWADAAKPIVDRYFAQAAAEGPAPDHGDTPNHAAQLADRFAIA